MEMYDNYSVPLEDSSQTPIMNDQQLGQDILKTFARTADSSRIEFIKVKRKVPILENKKVLDKEGKEVSADVITGWVEQAWEIPIRSQPDYRELITDDISRSFLSETELFLYRDLVTYCKQIKSFAQRYNLDLKTHHNNMVDETMALIVSSGSRDGQRVKLAKSNYAETIHKSDTIQRLQGQEQKKRFLGII